MSTVALSLAAGAAAADDCPAPADLNDGWAVSTPAAQGLDPLVCRIAPRFEAWTEANLHGVVARHGSLVYEHYLTGEDERWGQLLGRVAYDAGKLHDLRSITKSLPRYWLASRSTAAGSGVPTRRSFHSFPNTPICARRKRTPSRCATC